MREWARGQEKKREFDDAKPRTPMGKKPLRLRIVEDRFE
jgi:hypothetical protein